MRTDWSPTNPVFFDCETQSAINLREVGAKLYLQDRSTRLMSAVFLCGGVVTVYVPLGRAPKGLDSARLWPEGFALLPLVFTDTLPQFTGTFVAHNALGFDAPAWERFVPGPQPAWCDTLPLARAAGLPGKLDELGKTLLGRGKEDDRALKLLYAAKAINGKIRYNVGTVPLWESMLRYNIADVLLLERVYEAVKDHGEPDVLEVDTRINSRGILVDVELLQALQNQWVIVESEACKEIAKLTGNKLHAKNIKSLQQVGAWLKSQGVYLDSLTKGEVEEFLDDPESWLTEDQKLAAEVLKLRGNVVRAGRGKLDAIAERTDFDNRVRGSLVYYGAATGRWSGRGVQPQNFVRGGNEEEAVKEYEATGNLPTNHDALSAMVRPVFRAAKGRTLAIADYASIEARGVAWVAGEQELLSIFAAGKDVYMTTAEKVFGAGCSRDKRQIGKTIILGCGYGMGVKKFGMYCDASGADLVKAGTTAEQCVKAYREAYPKIPQLWKAYGLAAFTALEKGEASAGRCKFLAKSYGLSIQLPSGREIVYRGAKVESVVPGYCRLLGLPEVAKPTVTYTHPRYGPGKQLYGGLLTENIVQGLCRDLLATALVRCEVAGIETVLHVHDEIVAEVLVGQGHEVARIMSEVPPWAAGFPIDVEGFESERYVKKAFKGSRQFHYQNGRAVG